MNREELREELLKINSACSGTQNQALALPSENAQLAVLEKSLMMLFAILNPDSIVDDPNYQPVKVPMDDMSLGMVLWSLNRMTDDEIASIVSIVADNLER